MQHLSAELPGLLEPVTVRRLLADQRHLVEQLESQSLLVTTAERAKALRGECSSVQERLIQLARAGYSPLRSMPAGSYVAPEFARLGELVSDLLRRTRRVIDHCTQIENLIRQREQAEFDHDHRRRFPQEMYLLEEQRDILCALYPDRWLLLFEGAIHGEFDSVQEAIRLGEEERGRDVDGKPRYLIFCHRAQRPKEIL